MKSFVRVSLVLLLAGSGISIAAEESRASLKQTVDAVEDAWLAKLENTSDVEKLFDDYEAALKELIRQYPGRAEPWFAFLELFEKCDTKRTTRLLNEFLARPDLPEKIRAAFGETKKAINLIGTAAPLEFTALDHRVVRLDGYRGQVLVVDFWATWCGPCVREQPKFKTLEEKLRPRGLRVVGVSFDDDRSKLETFIKARGIPWPQIYPTAEERSLLLKNLGVSRGYLPTVFLIGKDGKIRNTVNSRFHLEDKIAALLNE